MATSRESRKFEVYFVKTRPVRRLVARNGVPLSARDQAEVDRKAEALATAIAEGRTVSEQPGLRLASLLDSFDFVTAGREFRNGRATLVLDFKPRTDRKTRSDGADAALRTLEGRLHVDEADRRVALLDASSAGREAGVARGVKLGSLELLMEFTPVEERVWLPRRVVTVATGRAFFFRTFRVRQTTVYSNYRKFRVDTDEVPVR